LPSANYLIFGLVKAFLGIREQILRRSSKRICRKNRRGGLPFSVKFLTENKMPGAADKLQSTAMVIHDRRRGGAAIEKEPSL